MKTIKNAVFSATACFTCVTYFLMLVMRLLDGAVYVLNFKNLTHILVFSVILGACGLIFSVRIPRAIARAIHFAVMCLNFALVIATIPYGTDFRMIFPATLVFMIVYWIVVGIGCIFARLFRASQNSSEQ